MKIKHEQIIEREREKKIQNTKEKNWQEENLMNDEFEKKIKVKN